MDTHGGGAVKDFMHRYLEVVPQNSTVAPQPSGWVFGGSVVC